MILVNPIDEIWAVITAQSEPHGTGIYCNTQPYACTCGLNKSCDLINYIS